MKDIRHLLFVSVLAIGALAVYISLRAWFIPDSFGKVGHYRNDSVSEIAAAPVRFAGEGACADCHTEKAAAKDSSSHRNLRCESCHGPQARHAVDPGAVRPSRVREEDMRRFCRRCHGRHISRPRTIRQIDEKSHNPDASCALCHDPHRPRQ